MAFAVRCDFYDAWKIVHRLEFDTIWKTLHNAVIHISRNHNDNLAELSSIWISWIILTTWRNHSAIIIDQNSFLKYDSFRWKSSSSPTSADLVMSCRFRMTTWQGIGWISRKWSLDDIQHSLDVRQAKISYMIVRRAGLIWSQQDFEWWWSVPLSSASLY